VCHWIIENNPIPKKMEPHIFALKSFPYLRQHKYTVAPIVIKKPESSELTTMYRYRFII
jgi:hypothetical protein